MRHLTVGVFQDETLGGELGKKGTLSDIAMYNRKTDEYIFTFMSPVEDRLAPKSQIISTIDVAVVVFSQMSRELGETIVMLDLLGVKEGIAITTPYTTPDQIANLTKKTAIGAYRVQERNPGILLENLKEFTPSRDASAPVVVVIDHAFSVKGVGEVLLGFVKVGTVKKYDKLRLLPLGKEVQVRSIQVQDEDVETAEAGTRVGIATKGATVEELERGSVLTASSEVRTTSDVNLAFTKSPFYVDQVREGAFHATVGMQTNPVTLSNPQENAVRLQSSRPIVYEPRDQWLLLDLNAKRTRIIGKGIARE